MRQSERVVFINVGERMKKIYIALCILLFLVGLKCLIGGIKYYFKADKAAVLMSSQEVKKKFLYWAEEIDKEHHPERRSDIKEIAAAYPSYAEWKAFQIKTTRELIAIGLLFILSSIIIFRMSSLRNKQVKE